METVNLTIYFFIAAISLGNVYYCLKDIWYRYWCPAYMFMDTNWLTKFGISLTFAGFFTFFIIRHFVTGEALNP